MAGSGLSGAGAESRATVPASCRFCWLPSPATARMICRRASTSGLWCRPCVCHVEPPNSRITKSYTGLFHATPPDVANYLRLCNSPVCLLETHWHIIGTPLRRL